MLQIWTEAPKSKPWSLKNSLSSIDADLSKIKYPSTTTRAPRSILKCLKLKANECRVLLLVAYPIFQNYLPEKYYQHLQKLAFGIHIGESSALSADEIEDMDTLLNSFVDDFPYEQRYIVQNIHCVKHFANTVNDFGPLFNYSTFNYESVIGEILLCIFNQVTPRSYMFINVGCLASSIHGTKQIGIELACNLELLKQTYDSSKHHCSSSIIAPFIQYLKSGRMITEKSRKSNDSLCDEDWIFLEQIITEGDSVESMKSSESQVFSNFPSLMHKFEISKHLVLCLSLP